MNVFAIQQFHSFRLLLFPLLMFAKRWKLLKLSSFFSFWIFWIICAYGDIFYWLTSMLMSKSVNNDVSKDSPFSTEQNIPSIIAFNS